MAILAGILNAMRRLLVVAVALIAAGGFVVALPDEGPRLFSISRDHGPSAVDAAGTALVLAGWGLLVATVWRRRARVARRLGAVGITTGVVLLVAGGALIAWSVAGDHGAWWVAGAALAAAPQAVAVVAAR